MSKATDRVDQAGSEEDEAPPPSPGAVVATSHPLAVDAALETLRAGGNAVDAAVCAAAVLGVVEPMSTSIGGDCYALVWDARAGRLSALNGSGRAPAAASLDDLDRRGIRGMPQDGVLSVTVPGALDGFDRLLRAHGRRDLGAALEPAIRIARDGYEVTPTVARDWQTIEGRLAQGHGTDVLLPGGRAPRAGERFALPDLAATLEQVAQGGIEAFYRGPIAARIAATCAELGGWLRAEDLAEHASDWVEPLELSYRGHPIYELPPNTQGLVVLQALGMLEELPMADLPEGERMHVILEALKLAFADAFAHLADADHMRVSPERLLDLDYLRERSEAIGETATAAPAPGVEAGDTVYVAVVDEEGNACSLIHSIYQGFGANVVVPGTGIVLQNRGALFSTDPRHPNALGPRKRSYHTIIPAMAFRAGAPWLVFGVVGGYQQPQAQVQLLVDLVDLGMEPQPAVDAPRARWLYDATIRLEDGMNPAVAQDLERRGHQLTDLPFPGGFGGAQAIRIDVDSGERTGASDPRKDGRVGRTEPGGA